MRLTYTGKKQWDVYLDGKLIGSADTVKPVTAARRVLDLQTAPLNGRSKVRVHEHSNGLLHIQSTVDIVRGN